MHQLQFWRELIVTTNGLDFELGDTEAMDQAKPQIGSAISSKGNFFRDSSAAACTGLR